MDVKIGTFNLNNLFSRFDFQGAIDALHGAPAEDVSFHYEFTDPADVRIRTFHGRLVKAKDEADTRTIAERIREMDVDVLAVQEVENIDILRQFNREHLDGMYATQVLIEGNDPRFIDVGILSKLPVGAISSYQTRVDPSDPAERVFSRDLLEVEILNASRSRKLFTLFNTHLKSNFVPFNEDQDAGHAAANERRRRQAAAIAGIIAERTRPRSSYVLTGDMNDSPDSPFLAPFVNDSEIALHNALTNPAETRPPKPESTGPGPQTTAWTHRFKPGGQPPRFELYDQLWLSPSLRDKQTGAMIGRRKNHKGDGSDHDPAWITLQL
jgi:endonuclease/exonuclease/phosphatase family metal-dependent hydrolase